jgi:cytochrome c peroxidase
MKKLATVLAVVALTAGSATVALAATAAGSGIYQTPHDMNFKLGPAVEDTQDRLCAYCHTPHHAYTASDAGAVGEVLTNSGYAPLWSHGVTTQQFTPYASTTFDTMGGQSMSILDPLVGPSRLCMSCHDGSVALDTYYGQTGTTKITNGSNTYFGSMPLIEIDGVKTHPIGFDATAVATGGSQADSHLWANFTNNTYRGNTNTIKVADRLYSGTYFTCSTCHDVHNKFNQTATSIKTGTQHFFLMGGQTNSALCITCHNQAETTYGSVPVTNGSPL